MTHLTPDEFVDAIGGTLNAAARQHLRDCTACAAEAAQLRTVLGNIESVATPEPSPLFWERFSARVRAAIADEATPRAGWRRRWFEWPVLAPIGAIALLLLALGAAIVRQPTMPIEEAVDARDDVRAAAGDDLAALGESEWVLVSQIVGTVDLETASEAGIVVKPGDVEQAALELTTDQQRELVRLLQAEIDKVGS